MHFYATHLSPSLDVSPALSSPPPPGLLLSPLSPPSLALLLQTMHGGIWARKEASTGMASDRRLTLLPANEVVSLAGCRKALTPVPAVLRLFYGFIGSCERDEYSS